MLKLLILILFSIYSRLICFKLILSKALVQYLKDNNITIYVLTLSKDFAKQRYNTPYACNVI